jgi:HAD superfamily hydrolase (TIGR01490 family)
MPTQLALFDLDNTLLAGDSDHAWGEFLIDQGLVDADSHRAGNDGFYADYLEGQLDIHAYVNFTLQPVLQMPQRERQQLHQQFLDSVIAPMILQSGRDLVNQHRDQGETCIIVTATNSFITKPIAQQFGVDILLATDVEEVDGLLTGKIEGIPCYQEGKVRKLNAWIEANNLNGGLNQACFYTDSINDLPLLEQVATPVAVDPDDKLAAIASERHWKILSLRS